MAEQSPNIVMIMADQLAPQFIGAYGHPLVKTPHIDALAERGARFDAAYCNAPLCAPARFSLMSGRYPTRIGAYDNASEFPSSIPTFAHYLGLMGYRTCLSGKMHFVGPDQLHGFDERLTTDIYPSDYAWTPDWEASEQRIDKWYHNMDSVREAGVAATTFQIEYDEEVAFFAKRKIFDYARLRETPFCLVVSFIHPHDPYVARPEWWDLYDDAEIDLPRSPLGEIDPDPFSKRVLAGIQADSGGTTPEQIRAARRAYYANTSYFDSKVGELTATLEEAGLADDTVVIVTADHGDMLGERGHWYKMCFFERSVRVPLVFAGPGVARGEVSQACSHVDLLPTFLDIAAQNGDWPVLDEAVDGRSLWPLAAGEEDSVDEAISEYCAEMTAYPVLMIRRGRYKYIHCDSDPPQLYDLAEDPEERVNLADEPAHLDLAQDFAVEVRERWDSEEIRRDVIASQRRRRVVHAAMENRKAPSWDYNPLRDAASEYVRNHMDWIEAAARSRFPPIRSCPKRS